MRQPFRNKYPGVVCCICDKAIAVGAEFSWDRTAKARGEIAKKWHIACDKNGTLDKVNVGMDMDKDEEESPKPKVEAAPKPKGEGDFFEGLAERILPYIDGKITQSVDGIEEKVDSAIEKKLDGMVLTKVNTVVIENKTTGETKDLGIQHKQFPLLMKCLGIRDKDGYHQNILLPGPTGSGKSKAFENAAKALGYRYGFVGMMDTPYDLLGYKSATGEAVTTEFEDFYTNGGCFVGEELDSWDQRAQLALNNALANGKCAFASGTKNRSKDFVFGGNANTYGYGGDHKYVGRNPLDAAFLSRFATKIAWDYYEDMERALSGNLAWAERVIKVRHAAVAQGLQAIICPRKTYVGAAYLAGGMDQATVEEIVLFAGIKKEQLAALKARVNG